MFSTIYHPALFVFFAASAWTRIVASDFPIIFVFWRGAIPHVHNYRIIQYNYGMKQKNIVLILFASLVVFFCGNSALASAPVISNVRAENIISSGAQIKWDTDQPSNSRVAIGLSSSNYSSGSSWSCNGSSESSGMTESVTSHCINLTNLSYNTVYYVKVESMNSVGEDAQLGGYSFLSGSSGSSGGTSGSSGSGTSPSSGSGSGESAPQPPSGLSLNIASNGTDLIMVWSDNSSNEQDFKIFWRPSGGTWTYLTSVAPNQTNFTYYNHPSGSYEYHLNACVQYLCSADSNTAFITVYAQTANTPPNNTATTTYQTTTNNTATTTYQTTTNNQETGVSGTVKDSRGQAVAGAGIYVYNQDFTYSGTVHTDSSGYFKALIPPGSYTAEIFPPYDRNDLLKPPNQQFSLVGGELKNFAFAFTTPFKIISGSVLFSSGQAVGDAMIGAYSKNTGQWISVSTNSSGQYSLNVSGGTWQMGVMPKDGSGSWPSIKNSGEISFANDTTAEIKNFNFTVVLPNNTLVVTALDQGGTAIKDAEVIIDTKSAADTSQGTLSQAQFRKTDSAGKASFSLGSGTYYVRGAISPDLGYVNPPEQRINLTGSSTQVQLTFIKQALTKTFILSGITVFEGGSPAADAFVWGWSESGRSANTRSNAAGEFNLSLTEGRWHIGTGIDASTTPYKSSELVLDVFGANVSGVELLLKKLNMALPEAVQVFQSSANLVVAEVEDGAKIKVPANAASPSGSITVKINPTVEAPSQASAQVVSTVYNITIRGTGGQEITTLADEVEITLPYDEKVLAAEGVTENNLIPSFFDESAWIWVSIDNFTIDKDKNIVIARVNHLTRFALIAAADITPPTAPTNLNISPSAGGLLKLSWKNPVKDFDHAKIYRSEKKGELGKAVFAEVTGETKTDGPLKIGQTYYYVARSVDPAGNESTNTDQLPAVAEMVGTLPPGQTTKLAILRNLTQGSKGEDVITLQNLLLKEGVYPKGLITGFFGRLTKQAVIRFQEKYMDEILKPVGLVKGSGFVGQATRKKINQLLPQ